MIMALLVCVSGDAACAGSAQPVVRGDTVPFTWVMFWEAAVLSGE